MLKILGRPNSYNVQKVLWLLDELSLDYENIDIGSTAGDLDNKAFLALNPHGLIPVLQDEKLIVWESNTILRYLASKYGSELFWSNDPGHRSNYERWMDWELANLQPDFLGLFWEYYRTPEKQRDAEKIQRFALRCQMNISLLNTILKESKYITGSVFSIADIVVGTSFYRYFNMGISVDDNSNVNNWYLRLSDRVSYQRKIAVPFEELMGRIKF